jgi:DNA-binding NarL/FixJ family response regulator
VKPIQVFVHAPDPVDRAGVTALLRTAKDVTILAEPERTFADVIVLADATVAGAQLNLIRRIRAESTREPGPRTVIVADRFDENNVLAAVQCGVTSILPSASASEARLVPAVVGAVRGVSLLPRCLQAAMLEQLDTQRRDVLEPNGLTLSGLMERELDTIRLVAEGLRTDEIASKLSCSEGTVKGHLHAAMKRLGLTNRTHTVAYAIRTGALPVG